MEATDLPLDELKQVTLAKVQELVTDQSGNGSPRYTEYICFDNIVTLVIEYKYKVILT